MVRKILAKLVALVVATVALGVVLTTPTTIASTQEIAESTQVTLDARQDWQDTGIVISPGMHIEISYLSGSWSPWPGGVCDAGGIAADPYKHDNVVYGMHASVIGRIGENPAFIVGNYFTADTNNPSSLYPARLYLGINDRHRVDNSGSVTVEVTTW